MAHGAGGKAGRAMTAIAVDSVGALRDRVIDAAHRGVPLRIAGRGTWLHAGRPVRAGAETLSTRSLSGITEYVPGDLTLTARAGTTLAEIREATSAHGQWLALDPPGSDDGTLGATLATASAGPLRSLFGAPRDLALGVEFVTGAGAVARGGGRVVKNVAGFDLTRLLTGSWGTLGVITEATVRLHARPEADESVAVAVNPVTGVARVRQLLRRLPFTPYACEVVNAKLAHIAGTGEVTALFRLGGNVESVRGQRTALAELGDARDVDAGVWQRLAIAEPDRAIVFRLSTLPSEIERVWDEAVAISAACHGTLIHASPARGVVRCAVPMNATSVEFLLRQFLESPASNRIGERIPEELWPACAPPPAADRLSVGIKRTFDPHSVLNIGILGEPA
jgi:glycolate oxidase FAD binding subunit